MKVFLMVLIVVLAGAGGYLIGAANQDRIGARAVIYVGGERDVQIFNVLSQVERVIAASDGDKALEIIAKQKALIQLALETCYGQITCEEEFSGVYPETWLAELHPNKSLKKDAQ